MWRWIFKFIYSPFYFALVFEVKYATHTKHLSIKLFLESSLTSYNKFVAEEANYRELLSILRNAVKLAVFLFI